MFSIKQDFFTMYIKQVYRKLLNHVAQIGFLCGILSNDFRTSEFSMCLHMHVYRGEASAETITWSSSRLKLQN